MEGTTNPQEENHTVDTADILEQAEVLLNSVGKRSQTHKSSAEKLKRRSVMEEESDDGFDFIPKQDMNQEGQYLTMEELEEVKESIGELYRKMLKFESDLNKFVDVLQE